MRTWAFITGLIGLLAGLIAIGFELSRVYSHPALVPIGALLLAIGAAFEGYWYGVNYSTKTSRTTQTQAKST